MGIKEDMDKMFHIKKGECVTKREYSEYRKHKSIYTDKSDKYRKNQIEEELIYKQETFEEREKRLENIDTFKINDVLERIDKKFCANIEEFMNNYGHKFHTMSLRERSEAIKTGKDIVINFILDRSNIIIESNAIYIPDCKGESDMMRWFNENCNNLCIGIPMISTRHVKDGVDICSFIGGMDHNGYCYKQQNAVYCEDNHYRPLLNKYMGNKQRQVYGKFYEFIGAQSISIELEDISSNFVRYKHPSTVDMVICYEKDKDIRVPVLELHRKKKN